LLSSILKLLITQSVDNIVVATDAAFLNALFVTSKGSIIPSLIKLQLLPVTTLIPHPFLWNGPYAIPALLRIVLYGALIALSKTLPPLWPISMLSDALCRAIPAPETIPSLIAAFVAHIASSTRSFFSFNSTSEFAPTFTIAILADSLANLFSSLTIS
jgi:hypothetical protein